jgi:small-conductance mechanosensitive channel
MNTHPSRLIALIYFPVSTRDWPQRIVLLSVLALCLVFIIPTALAEPPANTNSEAVKKPPTAISIADITGQAEDIKDHLQWIETDLSDTDIEEQAREALDNLNNEINTMQIRLDNSLSSRVDRFEILELDSNWNDVKKSLTTQQELFTKRSDTLSKELENIHEKKQIWRLTQKEVRHESAPVTVKKQVTEILALLHKLQVRLKSSRNLALDILALTSKQQDRVKLAIERIKTAENNLVSNALNAQDSPLWTTGLDNEEIKLIPDNFLSRLEELKTGLIKFIKENHIYLLIHTIFTLFLGWFISRRCKLINEETKVENYGLDALKHPWSAAMLFSLYMTAFIYVDRTLGFIFLTIISSLPLWFYVVSSMLPATLRVSLIIITLIGFVEEIRSVFGGFTLLSRWTLLVEFVVAIIALHCLLLKQFQQIPSYLRNSFWYKFMQTWLRYSIPIFGAGIVAVILGYSELAGRIAFLMIWGPIAAATFIVIVRILEVILQSYIDTGHFDFLNMIKIHRHPFVTLTRRILRILGFLAWAFLILRAIQLLNPVLDVSYTILTTQMGIDPVKFSLGGILAFSFTLWFSWLLARCVNLVLDNEIFSRMSAPPGVPLAITTFSRYIILVAGFLTAISVLGFSMDKITILLGALGVGIGFGLQNITNNFVSGIILLFERPIRVGDKIQFDDLIGKVSSIGIRASKITTFEGSDVIVPNADFISSRVINWTFSDEKRRVIVPFGVSYNTDPEQVLELLLKVAKDHPEIIDSPEPEALFQNFGESSLDFELRAWTESIRGWVAVKSDLAVTIHKALKEANIDIPFPQRDLNFRNIPELQDAFSGPIKQKG